MTLTDPNPVFKVTAFLKSAIVEFVVISTFTEGLLQKAAIFIRPPADWSSAVTSHAAVICDACSIQISSQNIRIRC